MSRPKYNIVGLDPSLTSFGIALANGTTKVIKPKTKGGERLTHLESEVGTACLLADFVVIEGYSYGSKFKREALGELGGVIRKKLWELGIPFVEIPPTKLKMFATGNGKADKEEMKDAATSLLGADDDLTSDEYDALWLQEVGLHLAGGSTRMPPTKCTEALKGLELPEEIEK